MSLTGVVGLASMASLAAVASLAATPRATLVLAGAGAAVAATAEPPGSVGAPGGAAAPGNRPAESGAAAQPGPRAPSAQPGRIEPAPAFVEPAASEALRKALAPSGWRVLAADGSERLSLWLRSAIPVAAKRELLGVVHPELSDSELLGVVSFPRPFSDFKGQRVAAGSYTLRYQLLPENGYHIGVAPSRDLVLLIPVEADRDPAAVYAFADLVGLSNQASHTHHPAPLALVAADGGRPGQPPALTRSAEGWLVLGLEARTSAGLPLPLGLVVEGSGFQ